MSPQPLSGEFPMNVVVRMFHVVEEAVGGIREASRSSRLPNPDVSSARWMP